MSRLIEASPEAVKQVFDSAFMSARIDDDGDVVVKPELFHAFINVKQGQPLIKVLFQFESSHNEESIDLLRSLNEFNKVYILIKAYWMLFGPRAVVRFETDLRVDDGFSPVALIQTVRQSEKIIADATDLHRFLK